MKRYFIGIVTLLALHVSSNAMSGRIIRGLSRITARMHIKKPFTKISAATLLSGTLVATSQKSNNTNSDQPFTDKIVAVLPLRSLTDRIMNSLWQSKPSDKGIDAQQASTFYDASTASHVDIRCSKELENSIVIESEAYKKASVPEFFKKLPATVAVSTLPFAIFGFDFAYAPQLRGTSFPFEFEDSHTKCNGTLHFSDATQQDDLINVEAQVRCTTTLSREQYFGFLSKCSAEDEQRGEKA